MTFIEENCVRVSVKQVLAALNICIAWNFKENKQVILFLKIFEKYYGSPGTPGWDKRHREIKGGDNYYLLEPGDACIIKKILGPYSSVYLRMWFNEVEGQTGGES
jgi:hypothetical protein